MDKDKIIEVLGLWNFWNREIDAGIHRVYTDKIFKSIKYEKVITLTGIRRSGKSTILKQIVKTLLETETIPKENTLIVNLEEPRLESIDVNSLIKIYEAYKEIINPKGKPYIFLDEVQEIKGWEKFVRSLSETKEAYIFITGSSAKLMSEELSTLLTGRQLTFEIFPLSFEEFLKFKNVIIKSKKDIYLNAEKIRRLCNEYIKTSSFPETVEMNDEIKKKTLFEYYDTILNRDVVKRYRIREIDKIRSLARYYLTNISSLITYTKTGKFLNTSAETVSRFSEYLKSSKLLFFIARFSFSVKEQENSPRKVYCIDNGLAESLGFTFMENRGKFLENVVAIELQRKISENPNIEVYYWKDYAEKEVDFVIKEGNKIKQLIQVTYSGEYKDIKEREITAMLAAANELKCKNLNIITWDYQAEKTYEKNKKIIFIPLWKWLLEKV